MTLVAPPVAPTHSGAFDASAQADVLAYINAGSGGDTSGQTVAISAGSTMLANMMTGSGSDVTLVNTQATPGTITTRTATQLIADLTASLGFVPPVNYAWLFRLTHTAAATLTLSAGTGVTFGTGTYTVLTGTFRDFLCVITSVASPAISVQTSGVGTWT